MKLSAVVAPARTVNRPRRIARSAAMKNVLSPSSETKMSAKAAVKPDLLSALPCRLAKLRVLGGEVTHSRGHRERQREDPRGFARGNVSPGLAGGSLARATCAARDRDARRREGATAGTRSSDPRANAQRA